MLNPNQKKCVEHTKGAALVLATAGSGKTTVIIERCKALIRNGYCNENEILLVTFSNQAANEMKKRLTDCNLEWIGTFHSISFKLLQMHKIISEKTIIIDEYDKKDIFNKLDILDSFPVINRFETTEQQIYNAQILRQYDTYHQYLKDNKLIDFYQIIQIMLQELRENSKLRNALKEKFKFVMVDEFQDINRSQYELIKLIVNEEENIMCVGDDNQCIYAWRGARLENMMNFNRDWKNAMIYYLSQNYRSTVEIVCCSESVCEAIEHRLEKEDTFSERDGDRVFIHPCRNEGKFIAEKIKGILAAKPEDHTVAILVRSIKQVSNIENALLDRDIPYEVLMGNKILERKEIKVLMSYVRVVYYNDYTVLHQMVKNPSRGIGDKKIEKMMKILESQDLTLNTVISEENKLVTALEAIKSMDLAVLVKKWSLLTNPYEILQCIWRDSGLANDFNDDKYVKVLMEKARQFSKIEEFIQSLITLESDETSRVCIMTIHSAKGLEFNTVFIPGVSEGNIPHQNAIMHDKICDERRVLYVGMTRAKDSLYLTYSPAESHGDYFGVSRFLVNFPKRHSVCFPLDDY